VPLTAIYKLSNLHYITLYAVIDEFGKPNRRLQFLSRVSTLTRDIDIDITSHNAAS